MALTRLLAAHALLTPTLKYVPTLQCRRCVLTACGPTGTIRIECRCHCVFAVHPTAGVALRAPRLDLIRGWYAYYVLATNCLSFHDI